MLGPSASGPSGSGASVSLRTSRGPVYPISLAAATLGGTGEGCSYRVVKGRRTAAATATADEQTRGIIQTIKRITPGMPVVSSRA